MEKSKSKQSKQELSRNQKLAFRLVPALAAIAALSYGGAKTYENTEYQRVDTERVMLGQGDTPVGAVAEAVRDMSERDGFGVNEVPGITREGQQVAHELQVKTGDAVPQIGDEIEVTVLKNGFGHYKVEADPVDRNEPMD